MTGPVGCVRAMQQAQLLHEVVFEIAPSRRSVPRIIISASSRPSPFAPDDNTFALSRGGTGKTDEPLSRTRASTFRTEPVGVIKKLRADAAKDRIVRLAEMRSAGRAVGDDSMSRTLYY